MPDTTEVEQVLAALAETPPRLAALTASLDQAQLQASPHLDAWSAQDILAHLRACADVWGESILTMLAQDHPTLRYVSPRTWLRKTTYPTQDFHASLHTYTQQRHELLAVLQPLPPDGWSRGAQFTGTVKGREATVLSYAHRIANHEAEHLAQLEQITLDNG